MTEPTETPEPEIGPEAKFKTNMLLQWFVFPLIAVTLCVGLYLSFRLLTAESKSASDYLNDLRSGNPHRAWQAAFAIANQVNLGRLTESETPAVSRALLSMLSESSPSAGEIRHYFILTLGRLNYREAIPKLVDIAGAPGGDAAEKIYALIALGEMRAVEAAGAAESALGDADPGIRKTAAHYFGLMARHAPSGVDGAAILRPVLNDPVADVRWNAAVGLAEYHDPAAVPVLRGMLDRAAVAKELNSSQGLDETKIEKIIRAGLAASRRYPETDFRDVVRKLAEEDPRPAIQTAARETLSHMKETK